MGGYNKMKLNISDKALLSFEKNKYSNLIKEEWKYTNINKFQSIKYQKNSSNCNNLKTIKSKANKILITNSEIDTAEHSKEIFISNLNNAIKNNSNNCKKIFNKIIPFENNPNVALNTAYFNNGIFIHIKDNAVIKEPIKLIHSLKNISPDIFLNYRILLSIGKNVSVKFINEEIFNTKSAINTTWEINIENNSNVEFVTLANKHQTSQILNFGVSLNKNSILNYIPIDLAGKLIKNSYYFNLNKENSQCYISGLNILNNNDYIDNFIQINHNHKHTISNTSFYNLLNNSSTSIFYAKAIINSIASKAEAYQTNKNLLLSKKSSIHSNPQLEIYNNDVKCSHASTTGEIDKEALHYLRTRGISYEESFQLILNGFINNILEKISTKSVQKQLQDYIAKNVN